jgi:large subunit ribosomal protein L22
MAKAKAEKERSDQVATATLRHVRISAQKARLVLNLVKGKQVEPALQILDFSPKKGAKLISKLLRSAIINAKERANADVDRLWITGGWVGMGRTIRRYMPRARGSASPIRKRSAHITLILGER